MKLKEKLLLVSNSLGIEFVDPERVITDLLLERACSRANLGMWLETKRAREYLWETYGGKISFPGIMETSRNS